MDHHKGHEEHKEESNRISRSVVDAALEVHRELGPGLLESVYEEALAKELRIREVQFERQRWLPIRYKDELLDAEFRIDFLVGQRVILELKSVRRMEPLFQAQLLTYLKLSGLWLGLLLNFNVYRMRDGIQRIANG